MNSRERVKAALLFKKPDRIPRDLWAHPYIHLFNEDDYLKIVNDYPLDIYQRQYQEMRGLLGEYPDDLKEALKNGGNYKDI